MLILALTPSVFASEEEYENVKIFLGESREEKELVSLCYKLPDGTKKEIEISGTASLKIPCPAELPASAKLVSVTTSDGTVYSYGGAKVADKKTFEMYKSFFSKIWWDIEDGVYTTLIVENRWKMFANGLLVTLEITFGALIIGIILGFLIAAVRSTYDTTGRLKFLNGICRIYLTVIRGTPVVVQLMIMYFIILVSVSNGIFAAILAFGINSGAYVAEIVRSGIMSIDKGQMEAGRSLGFSYGKSMIYIICPQAFKNILPALGNEFIALLKETSVAGYVALEDITKAGDAVRGVTYSAFFPLIVVALIYLVIVMGLEKLMNIWERRLRSSDH